MFGTTATAIKSLNRYTVRFVMLFCLFIASEVYSQTDTGETSINSNSSSQQIQIIVGQAQIMRLSEPAQLIAVGDANIADATLVSSQTILLTPKSVGRTNFLALNSKDEVIRELLIYVIEPHVSTVNIRRGSEVITYVCREFAGCIESEPKDLSAPIPE